MLLPRLVTVCNVLVFQITTTPVAVLTEVSVPPDMFVTPYPPIVPVVITADPPINAFPPTYKSLIIPAPPSTSKAPVVVDVEVNVFVKCNDPNTTSAYVPQLAEHTQM